MAVRYGGDFDGGNNSNDATSFANRVKGFTLGFTAARVAPGDDCRGMASLTGSLAGVSITAGSGTGTLSGGGGNTYARSRVVNA
jgi:hypothetical protein